MKASDFDEYRFDCGPWTLGNEPPRSSAIVVDRQHANVFGSDYEADVIGKAMDALAVPGHAAERRFPAPDGLD